MSDVIKGLNGTACYENGYIVTKTRSGLLGNGPRNPELRVPLEQISYIHLQPQGSSNGYINFVLVGRQRVQNTSIARSDPSCVLMMPAQRKKFLSFKLEIESKMAALALQKEEQKNAARHNQILAELEQRRIAKQEQELAAQREQEKAALKEQDRAARRSTDALAALKKLAELREKEIITEDEFLEKRKVFLDQI